jgi:hypothetical protein
MWKVYDSEDRKLATTDDYAVAALVVSTFGPEGGYVVDTGKGRTVWVEGADGIASDSYDGFAAHIDRVCSLVGNYLTGTRTVSEAYSMARKVARSLVSA